MGLACALGVYAAGGPDEAAKAGWSFPGIAAELATGLLLALPAIFITRCLQVAGECFDQACGTNAVEIVFPSGEERSSPVGNLAMMATVLAAFGSGVQLELCRTVMDSYKTVPAGDYRALGAGALELLLKAFTGGVWAGVLLGLPFLAIAAGVEAALGFADRIGPGMAATSHSMQIKNMLALVIAIPAWDRIASGMFFGLSGLPEIAASLASALG
jgi:flagellar biosynthesis protein FliR